MKQPSHDPKTVKDEEPLTAHEPDRQTVEFFLGRTTARIDRLEGALERNWLAHTVLAGVGIALVLQIGGLQNFLAEYITHGKYDARPMSVVILAVFLYHFMKLGHLTTSINQLKELQHDLLRSYSYGKDYEKKIEPLSRTTNFFAESFRAGKDGIAFLLVATAIVSVAQASAFFLVFHAFEHGPALYVVLAFCALFVVVLFFLFVAAQKNQRQAGLVAGLTMAATAVLLISFIELT